MYKLNTTAEIETAAEYSDLEGARTYAQGVVADHGAEVTIVYVTADGSEIVADVLTPVPAGQYFKPFERIEAPKFQAPMFAGFIPAYTRKRVTATVYRSLDRAGWRIHDGRTGNFVDVANTKIACRTCSEMRQGRML